MAIKQRSGTWHFRFKLNGKEYTASTGLAATKRNRSEARQSEFNYRQALKDGNRPNKKIITCKFTGGVKEFLDWAEGKYRAHPNSYKRIKTSLASAINFFSETPISHIDSGRVDHYTTWRIAEHKVRDITIRHDLHALSTFFRYAIRQHWTSSNPIADVDIPSDAAAVRIHVLTPSEEQDYFQRAARLPNLYDVGRLMLNQGMRPEEVTVLAKEDIDLDRGVIHIRKGKSIASKRTLDMTSESRQILEKRMAGDSPWIFPSTRKPGCHIGRINSAHDSIVREAAKASITIKFVPYDFRHTFATLAAEAGISLPTLAALLGHESLRILHKYVHPSAENKKAAMARYDDVLKEAGKKAKGVHLVAPGSLNTPYLKDAEGESA